MSRSWPPTSFQLVTRPLKMSQICCWLRSRTPVSRLTTKATGTRANSRYLNSPYLATSAAFGSRETRPMGDSSVPTTRTPPSEPRSEEHTSELQSLAYLVCRLLLEKKKTQETSPHAHIPAKSQDSRA